MFRLYQASNIHALCQTLIRTLQQQPANNLFTQEIFLAETPALQQWLLQNIALEFKVFANYQCNTLSNFLHSLSKRINDNSDTTSVDNLIWSVEAALRNLANPVFEPLQKYLIAPNLANKRYQLAQQISTCFNNYQIFRPELFYLWQQGMYLTTDPSELWQQALWLQIQPQLNPRSNPQLSIQTLQQTPAGKLQIYLPKRLFIFSLHACPPTNLAYLQALSLHTDIYCYQFTPLPPTIPMQLHTLLKNLGSQAIEFQHQLQQTIPCIQSQIQFQTPKSANNLQQLQITLNTQIQQPKKLTPDGSISIHACHSKLRELEVVYNNILHSLNQDPELQLRDCIIVAPNIQAYAHLINSVFKDIPHQIHAKTTAQSIPLLPVLIQLLNLSASRFEFSAVFNLLEQTNIYTNFDLSLTDLELIKHWLTDTNVRWGKSAAHKQQLNLPATTENTWQATLERLLMGYAVLSPEQPVNGILPYCELEGSAAQALGGLYDFMQILFTNSEIFAQAHTLSTWLELLQTSIKQVFIANPARQQLQQCIQQLHNTFNLHNSQTIELSVIIEHLTKLANTTIQAQNILNGKLNFCSIATISQIPFQIIAILGMNQGEFPAQQLEASFNLISQTPQFGDPNPINTQRQQFLELILSAQRQLIISYQGQSAHNNQTLPAAMVVSELLESLQQDYQLSNLVITHPLHAFNSRYFDNSNPKLYSYSNQQLQIASAVNTAPTSINTWWHNHSTTPSATTIQLQDLISFYRQPQKYFFRQQLGLQLQTIQANPATHEPFIIDNLSSYNIAQISVAQLLQHQNLDLSSLQARGQWLTGAMGAIEFQKLQSQLDKFVSTIQTLDLGNPISGYAIDTKIGNQNLIGELNHVYTNGSLLYRFAALKGKDLIAAIIHHALINQQQCQNTYLISQDASLCLRSASFPNDVLEQLIHLYQTALSNPNIWFTEVAFAYIQQSHQLKINSRTKKPAINSAQEKFKYELNQPYNLELQLLYTKNQHELVFEQQFLDICDNLLVPIWTASHC